MNWSWKNALHLTHAVATAAARTGWPASGRALAPRTTPVWTAAWRAPSQQRACAPATGRVAAAPQVLARRCSCRGHRGLERTFGPNFNANGGKRLMTIYPSVKCSCFGGGGCSMDKMFICHLWCRRNLNSLCMEYESAVGPQAFLDDGECPRSSLWLTG